MKQATISKEKFEWIEYINVFTRDVFVDFPQRHAGFFDNESRPRPEKINVIEIIRKCRDAPQRKGREESDFEFVCRETRICKDLRVLSSSVSWD